MFDKGVSKPELNKIQEVQQGPRENPTSFFERAFEAYWQYTDIDPERPDNTRLVKVNFIRVPQK